MKKRFAVFFAFFVLCLTAKNSMLAQNKVRDSLKEVLNNQKVSEGEKIITLGRLSNSLYFDANANANKQKATRLLDSALTLASHQKDGQYKAHILALKAFKERLDNSPIEAKTTLYKALKALRDTDNKAAKGYVYYCKGWLESRDGQSSRSIKTFIRALEYLENEDGYAATNTRASIYSELSAIYAVWKDYKNQEKYARKFYEEAKYSNDNDIYVQALQMLGSYFEARYRSEPQNKKLLDSAFYYDKLSVNVFLKHENRMTIPSQLPFTSLNIANLYSEFYPEMFQDSTFHYLNIALEKGLETKQNTVIASVYGIKSQFSENENNLDEAIKNLLKAEEYLKKESMPDYGISAQVARSLSRIYERKQEPENALAYYKKYIGFYQNIFDNEKMAIGKEVEAKYESEKKEQQLDFLRQQIEQKRKLNIIYILLAVATILALFFLFIAYRQRSKNFKKKEHVHQLEMDAIKKGHKISLLSAMIDGQENERTRLARDLHDGLGGLLSGIKIELSVATNLVESQKTQQLLKQTLEHIDQAVDELRRIARSMMPSLLLQYGLAEAMREYCNTLNSKNTEITCQIIKYQNILPEHKQIVVYRIFQELLNNALKHANASHILVQFQQQNTKLFLTVEDDGKGFNTSEKSDKKSSGLMNINARVAFLEGHMEMHSKKGQGTTVQIEFEI